jgi:hypothetical protein
LIDVKDGDKSIDVINAYFQQHQELANQIKNQILSTFKQQEALHKSIVLEPILLNQEKWHSVVEFIKVPRYELVNLSKQILEQQKSFQDLIKSSFEQVQKSLRELSSPMQEALLVLGRHGWFFDLDMDIDELWELEKALSEDNIVKAEGALIEHFESRIDEIETFISTRFPKREKIIRAAFNAHRREEYELSIPVLLTQTDGICKEVINEYLFSNQRNNNKPRTAIYVDGLELGSFVWAISSPLAQQLPIGASFNPENKEEFGELNRHMILHGESLEYGTKINSLKAISLINYVADILPFEKATS